MTAATPQPHVIRLDSPLNGVSPISEEISERNRSLVAGALPDYIPGLTRAVPAWFGIAVTTVDGRQCLVGDTGTGVHPPVHFQTVFPRAGRR